MEELSNYDLNLVDFERRVKYIFNLEISSTQLGLDCAARSFAGWSDQKLQLLLGDEGKAINWEV